MGQEDYNDQISSFLERRNELGAGLLDSYVIVFVVCSWESGSCHALAFKPFVRISINYGDIIESCPFKCLFYPYSSSPLEWERVTLDIAIGDCTKVTFSIELLASHRICDFCC